MSVVRAEYKTIKHIPTRECYQVIFEIPEENVGNLFDTLGYPTTGESKWVGIARLTEVARLTEKAAVEKVTTEGERIRTRAVLMCKDERFQKFAKNCLTHANGTYGQNEQGARCAIVTYCDITSRSELANNLAAQQKFNELHDKYKEWVIEQQYTENLERM